MSVEDLRRQLPLPELLRRTGHPELAEKLGGASNCPFHEDTRPSFSLYRAGDRFKWKCFALCGGGDEVDYLQRLYSCTFKEALQRWQQLI